LNSEKIKKFVKKKKGGVFFARTFNIGLIMQMPVIQD